jgi:hypothetical protein
MVLINVDFPRPVCPAFVSQCSKLPRTDADDVELEAPFEEFAFNLVCDGVETNITAEWSDVGLDNTDQYKVENWTGNSGAWGG